MQRDYKPLQSLVNRTDITNLKKQYPIDDFSMLVRSTFTVVLVVCSLPIFVVAILLSISLGWQYVLGCGLLIIASILICVFSYFKYQNSKWTQYVRLYRFAQVNNLVYKPSLDNSNHNGIIFNIGKCRIVINQLISNSNKIFEIANYTYTVGSGKSEHIEKKGYVMIQLDRNLPHMVLDSKSNNTNLFGISLSNLPVSFKNNQKLSLEGDFDKYFTLYAPKEYKRDALYVFTPDLMSLFIDESNSFDAEIVDNKLYIYSKIPFNMLDESILKRIFKIIDTVGTKIISQTKQYADERVENRMVNVVSEPGRRLKRQVSWVAIAVLVAIFIYFAIKIFINQ
jgi:hypothetical protein